VISIESKGSFKNTDAFLERMKHADIMNALAKYGQEGVWALARVTPTETGKTAASWAYEVVEEHRKVYSIIWKNTNVVAGVPVAILLQYGHGTGTGGFVQGKDFINPAIQPLFDRIANDVWKVVTTA
jgi:hypothetical protein